MSRVDFSNDTDIASPKGSLSNTLSDQTAFSSQANSLGLTEVSLWRDTSKSGG